MTKKNCFIDTENSIKIPDSPFSFFTIKKADDWLFAIDIIVSTSELNKIDFRNLFLIIQSYIMYEEQRAFAVMTIAIDSEKKRQRQIFSNVRARWLKTIKEDEFVEWLIFRVRNDSEYLEKGEFLGFRILFEKFFVEKTGNDVLSHLKPIFPWTKEIENKISNHKFALMIALEEIDKLKEENIGLKKIISTLNNEKITYDRK